MEPPAAGRPPPEGATEPDRETRIGFGALTPPYPLAAGGRPVPVGESGRGVQARALGSARPTWLKPPST